MGLGRAFPVSIARLVAFTWLAATFPAVLSAQTATFLSAQSVVGSGLQQPTGVALDAAGDLFVVDNTGNQVVKVAAGTGAQTTVGNGLKNPNAVALDSEGDLFISDGGNNRVVVVPADGGPQITVGASGLSTPVQIAVDSSENLYIVDNGNRQVLKVWANGSTPSAVATGLKDPQGVAVDSLGNVYISELTGGDIVKVASNGSQSTITGITSPTQLTLDGAGDLFAAGDGGVWEVASGTSTAVNIAPGAGFIQGVAVDSSSGLYITTSGDGQVARLQAGYGELGKAIVCPAGQTSSPECSSTVLLSFSVSANTGIGFNGPFSLGAPNGEFTLAEGTTCGDDDGATSCNVVINFTPALPGRRLGAVELADSHGNILSTVALSGLGLGPLAAFLSNNSEQTLLGNLNDPAGVGVDGSGNVYIADSLNQRLLKISASGTQTTVNAAVGVPAGIAVDGAGNVFVADVVGGTVVEIPGVGGGAPATFVGGLSGPAGVAIAASGNVLVADSGNDRVVEFIRGTGETAILGSGFKSPSAVAVGPGGAIFVADTGNNRIVKLPPNGGQEILGSGLNAPQGVVLDAAGDLLIADTGNDRVVTINTAGVQSDFLTDVKAPVGIAYGANGHLYVADSGNNRVAEVSLTPPTNLHFASTLVGTTSADSPQHVDAANVGNQPLNFTDVSYPQDFPIDFAADADEALCDSNSSLMPGLSCRLAFEFTPLKGGTLKETLTVTDNSLNTQNATQTMPVTGTALLPQNIVFLIPGHAPFNPAPVNLAGYAAATSGLPLTFKIVSGPAKLSGSTITLTGAGTVVIEASQAGNSSYAAATSVTKSVTITQVTPTIAWTAPAAIVYGTKLSAAQLDAIASAPGKLVYTPAMGTALAAGTQTLSVTFTPTNTSGYASVTATVKLTVSKAELTVTANNQSIKQGSKIPALTAVYSGFVNGDTAAKALTGAPSITTKATSTSPAGTYAITVAAGTLAAKNYSFKFVNGTLTITASSEVKKQAGVTPPLLPRAPQPVLEPLQR